MYTHRNFYRNLVFDAPILYMFYVMPGVLLLLILYIIYNHLFSAVFKKIVGIKT